MSGKTRWEPFAVKLSVGDLDVILEALREKDTKEARKLVRDLAATRSDLWRYLP